ncbi:hypothetical protein PTTG_29753 [Puccinia triticina 1-1 BBBD Race 1]|uniref:Myb-like domain-containing protein n=1 Tax=Puccinia triticina (isolate 1-1 / race 1 (BBBD)) TaxID=630390 RepID=A0A180G2T6_PUCT1|nr:hypothetical protein PTTG_29753 [Puccinia triticina 1-1 BBBD Race 1]
MVNSSIPLDPLLLSTLDQQPPTPAPPAKPRLPKSKLVQCDQLNSAAQQALEGVWESLQTANLANDQLAISRNLDRQFGELHASAAPFKQDALALIWPQCIANKTLKTAFASRLPPVYFAIRRANIAFVAEYVLYAMPGEEAYGKNDIVFACEGFLPLVLDPEMVLEPQSWKLFNELKVQIYIQRLDQSGQEEADSRVLPNLFVESLSSYSGLEVPAESEIEFEKLATETKEELIGAGADLALLQRRHPYSKFAVWALEFLHRCASRVDHEAAEQEQQTGGSSAAPPSMGKSKKRARQSEDGPVPSSPLAGPAIPTPASPGSAPHSSGVQVDINVGPVSEEEYAQDGEQGSKGYNPYRLGRGKGPTSAPRRRWTQEEYELLLEEVRLHSNKYDCMAQIMKRHGRGGEISETLKDQNNVSLKDKARNLTMEWQRHGYPEDKPWLKDAFARFSVKNMKRYTPRNGAGGGDGESGGGEEDEGSPSFEPTARRPKRVRPAPATDDEGPADPPDIGVLPAPPSFPCIPGFPDFSLDLASSLLGQDDPLAPTDLPALASSPPPAPSASEIHPLLTSLAPPAAPPSPPLAPPAPLDLGPLAPFLSALSAPSSAANPLFASPSARAPASPPLALPAPLLPPALDAAPGPDGGAAGPAPAAPAPPLPALDSPPPAAPPILMDPSLL